ncbi:tetratricopeptide repeat-containing glycosyltransferase family protein [Caballeronia sp. LZ029]|uniref:tetratricopeptide repeat-containing glycosyltransferase family protein n=1 Tax=Caballeronia sp. LZ029 TaxID=3038564 RepID=UPI0028574207|nr:tetratricopeptide repeat-containing glycosyltransferase family protein [Caballeronia sp. LZ029]MDR5746000.1 tetratricopeptide repeat-containing glycosyltransferase family protein [Caballeronia sp. LZ029]
MEHVDACLSRCTGIEERSRALLLKGIIAREMKRDADAAACFEEATRIFPSPASHSLLSDALTRCEEFGRAATVARAGLAFSTERYSPVETSLLFNNLGDALRLDRKFEDAANAYRNVIALMPEDSAAHYNLGYIFHIQDRIDAAIEHYGQALHLDPNHLENRSNLAYALLTASRFEEAWPHFEHRWVSMMSPSGQRMASRPARPIRRWAGAFENSSDQHLLVVAEQGFGDTLQFCRYLPMVLERFAKVGFVCPKPLQRLIAHSLGRRWSNLILLDDEPKEFWEWDSYIPLMSMPMAFQTNLETIPATIPYLSAAPHAAQKFASRLEELERSSLPRIGLVWAGGHAGLGVDEWRSIFPDQLGPLIDWPHACWVSLQKPESEDKRLKSDQRAKVVDWMDEMEDFADTAALIANLDLVISVDTSVAHLAAAMGKPVWLLNRFAGCWRWMRNRDDSPWYPTMRIFTQRERGNWNEVFERVLNELKRLDFRRAAGHYDLKG